MDRYKKAGIVLGITAFVVALVIIGVANRMANSKKNPSNAETDTNTSTQVVQENEGNVDSSANNVTENNTDTTVPTDTTSNTQQTDTSHSDESKVNAQTEVVNTFTAFSESDLLALVPGQDITEVMLVANKGVVLLTDNKKNERQIMYALDLFTTKGNTLHYYVSQGVYDSVDVGAKLNVTYSIYTNDNKVEFPVIKNIAVVN